MDTFEARANRSWQCCKADNWLGRYDTCSLAASICTFATMQHWGQNDKKWSRMSKDDRGGGSGGMMLCMSY